jgi:hypothetical protein
VKEGIGSTVALIDHQYKPLYTYNSTAQSKLSWNLGCDSVPEWWTRAGASRGERAVTSSNGQRVSCGRETRASRLHAVESLVFNTPPHAVLAETHPEVLEGSRRQTFCENVSELTGTRNLHNAQLAEGDLVPNEVDVYLDVLGVSMMDQIPRHIHTGDVGTVSNCSFRRVTMELLE